MQIMTRIRVLINTWENISSKGSSAFPKNSLKKKRRNKKQSEKDEDGACGVYIRSQQEFHQKMQ